MVELPDPIAEGDLDRTPFAHVLAHVASKQITGSIVLWPAEGEARAGQDRIRVEGGNITAARLVDRAPTLDRGLIPLFARAAGPYALYPTIDLVGDSGMTQRLDSYALLANALRSQSRDDAVDRLLDQLADHPLRLKGAPELKRFGFIPKEERFVETILAGPGTPEALVRACELGPLLGKRMLYMLFVTKLLEPYEPPAPRASTPPGRISSPGMTASPPTPRASLVGAPSPSPRPSARPPAAAAPTTDSHPVQNPISAGVPGEPGRHNSVGSAPRTTPTEISSQPPAAPPPAGQRSSGVLRFKDVAPVAPEPPTTGLSPDQLAFWKEVIERLRAIDTQNYFDMLGVPRDAGSDTIRKAYFALAKRWHPDRVSGPLAPIKPFVERIFGLLTQAQDTLADENKRGNYLRSVQDGGGTPEADRKLAMVVGAAMEHQKAEVLIRRRDFVGARAVLEGAIELNAEEADALASLAWVLFNLPNEKASQMLDLVDRAIRIAPKHDRAHYTRGMILRRMGNEPDAILAFRAAGAANPKNIDAMREVRLADMRSGQATPPSQRTGSRPRPEGLPAEPPPAEGGFLSKLFGSPKKK